MPWNFPLKDRNTSYVPLPIAKAGPFSTQNLGVKSTDIPSSDPNSLCPKILWLVVFFPWKLLKLQAIPHVQKNS
jgi:hypothetical protein